MALEKYNFTFKFHFSFSYPKFATNEQGKTLYKGYKLNLVLMEAEIDARVLMEAEMGRRLGGQHWVPTARWPQAVPLSATTCELDTRCLLATRQIFYCCPHQLTSTANHCRQLPNQWSATSVHSGCNHCQYLPIFGLKVSQSAEHQVSSTVKSGCEAI